jgi:predicted nucleic acid-binding protein
VWLYSFTADHKYGVHCKRILDDVEAGKVDAVISIQVVAEVSGVLYRQYAVRDTTKYVDAVLSYRMKIVPVTSDIVRSAAIFSRDYGILPYDGIHLATAKELECNAILSADKELDKQSRVERMDPVDYRTSTTVQ